MLIPYILQAARPLSGVAALALLVPTPGLAAQAPIRDNSLLIEEAYNQEAGVVQHAGLLQRASGGAGWQLTLSQEWPLWGQRHQLSYSIPLADGGAGSGLGDVALHYRFQLAGGGDEPVAFAPRLTFLLPTGDPRKGTGSGSVGFQLGLPASFALGRRFAAHLNAGLALTPSAEDAAGATATAMDLGAGASLIWHADDWVNFLVEGVWTRTREVAGPGVTSALEEAFVSPGARFAINLPGGRQVVPGIAWAIGVGPGSDLDSRLLVYLSFEHPFRGRLTAAPAAGELAGAPSHQGP